MPEPLDLPSLREDIAAVLSDDSPDPTAEWWARKTAALLDVAEERVHAPDDECAHCRVLAGEVADAEARGAKLREGIKALSDEWDAAGLTYEGAPEDDPIAQLRDLLGEDQ